MKNSANPISFMRKGWTLIELLVVIAIVLIIVSILSVSILLTIERARISRFVEEVRSIKTAVKMYYLDTKCLPALCGYPDYYSNGFRFLLEQRGVQGWRGPYISKKPIIIYGKYYDLLSPWGTYMWILSLEDDYYPTPQVEEKFSALVVMRYKGSKKVISDATAQKIDELLDDGNLYTGRVSYYCTSPTNCYPSRLKVLLLGL